MKTISAIIPALFAITGLAAPAPEALEKRYDSNVLLGLNPRFEGGQTNLPVTVGQCKNLPDGYVKNLSAIAPNGDIICYLYSDLNCLGAQPPCANGCPVTGRVENLADPPYFFDNVASSLRCELK